MYLFEFLQKGVEVTETANEVAFRRRTAYRKPGLTLSFDFVTVPFVSKAMFQFMLYGTAIWLCFVVALIVGFLLLLGVISALPDFIGF